MQAILTKVLPPTNTKGTRIKATCDRGSITLDIGCIAYHSASEAAHRWAVEELCSRFIYEDEKTYGQSSRKGNPWSWPFVSGSLPDGNWVHVLVEPKKR